MSLTATIIIPTFDHGPMVRYSIASVLAQTVDDFELFVIGDGAPAITRETVTEIARRDSRVHYIEKPKDPSKGETYRHEVLQAARGRIVAYLMDDDLWHPDHLTVLSKALQRAEFVNTLPVWAQPDGRLQAGPSAYVDLTNPVHRRLCGQPTSGFAVTPTCAGHTLDLYRRLPHGWRQTPPGIATDAYMWAQILRLPDLRAASLPRATAIVFHSPTRKHWSPERRTAELVAWWERLQSPDERRAIEARFREIEREAARRSRLTWPFWTYWYLLHRVPRLNRLAKRAAMSLVYRPAP